MRKRQLLSSEDWKAFGEELSGEIIESFDIDKYRGEYLRTAIVRKNKTFLGKFFVAAIAQKGMVTHEIFTSKNMLAGFSMVLMRKDKLFELKQREENEQNSTNQNVY